MTTLDFSKFKTAVDRQFKAMMVNGELFRTTADKDGMWETYLKSFPPGADPMYRKRTEHDCSCCRQFVRALGNVVTIVDGKVVSIWDTVIHEPAYDQVAKALSGLVKSAPIDNRFLHSERRIGTDVNYEDEDGKVLTWNHFSAELPSRSNSGRDYCKPGIEIGSILSEARATHDVFLRGLTELTMDSLDSVLELIAANSLYRGAEYKGAVKEFKKIKIRFDKLPAAERDCFAWTECEKVGPATARIRNTAIGTLLIDISEGVELEDAVNKFEKSIMAPSNYKRPTALVTKKQVEQAQVVVEELGLTSALERRHARLSDITVNNILFVDRGIRSQLGGSPFDGIATKVGAPKDLSRIDIIPIEKFISDILPTATSLEVMVENRHAGNLVSLIAPQHAAAGQLFKWTNNFSWAYSGDVADSVKERVKKAGGNVTGDLCCRLAWSNYDDLDLHMQEPGGGHIYYHDKRSVTGGMLDVDMNAGGGSRHRAGSSREPVENIFYRSRHTMRPGEYILFVHQYAKMETIDPGFEVEIDYLGDVHRFAYSKTVRDKERIIVARFMYSHATGIEFTHTIGSTPVSRTMWGLKSNEFHPASVVMRSPNHWDDQKGGGNKHYFFMLQGCAADAPARGFFNEFLRPELDKHRKVIEIVGGKMKVEPADDQLSGLGFSETVRSEIVVRVRGSVARTLKVTI